MSLRFLRGQKIGESLIKVSGQKSPVGNKGWNDRLAAGNLGNRGKMGKRGKMGDTNSADGRKEGRDPRMAGGDKDGQK